MTAPRPSLHVSLFLVEGFSMMALCASIEPLRALNRLTGERRYAWTLVARRPGPVMASCGIAVLAGDFRDAPPDGLITVVASLGLEAWREPAVLAWLRTAHRARSGRAGPDGFAIAAVSFGAVVLARAGLLDGRKAVVHWEAQVMLAARHPAIDLLDGLWCVDRGVATAAGGAAAMDMMLAMIGQRDGRDLAADVSDQFLHGPLRDSAQRQRVDVRWRYGLRDGLVADAVRLMEARVADPVRVARLAEELGLSERQLARRFEAALGVAPSDFALTLRLKHARKRLAGSADTLDQIARQCGFSSPGHFSRAFKTWAGEPPSAFRKRASLMHVPEVQGYV